MFNKIAIGALVLVVIGGALYYVLRQEVWNNLLVACPADARLCPDGSTVGRQGPACEFAACPEVAEDEKMPVVEESPGASEKIVTDWYGQLLAGSKDIAPLLAFDQRDYARAVAEGKLIVLYFYANWCPICRAEFPRMQFAFEQITDPGVIGFRVNYKDDEVDADEEALARKFGVAYQHTKVFVRNGQQLKKSPESYTSSERYHTEINAFLHTQ